MAVLGRVLIGSAERLDLQDLLSVDSYTQGDFKYLMKSFVGSDRPYILKGFEVVDPSNSIGSQTVAINIANSVVYYPESSAGPFFYGLEEGDPNAAPLVPELRKNATNYVYLVLTTFESAKDTRAFWDPDKEGGVGGEFTQDINTESVLTADVNVSAASFPDNVIPICKIKVGTNFIESIEDCRDMMFRLGTGGLGPNPLARYEFREEPLAAYKRLEPNTTISNKSDPNSFRGGDKNIHTLKEWMDVVMTRLLELSGSTYWYEDTSTYSLINVFKDALATSIRSKGTWENSDSTPGQLSWTEDIVLQSMTDLKDIIIRSGSKTLLNNQVMFVQHERDLQANSGTVPLDWFNGLPYVNGDLGYFENLSKGDWIKRSGDGDNLYLRVEEFYDSISLGGGTTTPSQAKSIRLSAAYSGASGSSQGIYTKGQFLASEVQVADRTDPVLYEAGGNLCWLASRSDRVLNVSNLSCTQLLIDITDHDGERAKCTKIAHGLSDKQRIKILATSNFNGEYQVEVESSDIFFISKTGGPFLDELSRPAYYATATTSANSTAYGFSLESANHGLDVDGNVFIAGSGNFNGEFKVFPKTATQFTFPIAGPIVAENYTSGFPKATSIEMYVRADLGPTKIEQGESKEIGKVDSQNIMSFIGMDNSAMMKPVYATELNYNTLDGFVNYNSSSADSLTERASKLTAMMADRIQDRNLTFELQNVHAIVSNPNGSYQDIAVFAKTGYTPKLVVIQPSTGYKTELTLTSTVSLQANQTAYFSINRNSNSAIGSLASLIVVDNDQLPLSENIFVFAIRGSTGSVMLWDKTPVREYESIIADVVAEVTEITLPAASNITSNQYFLINSGLDLNKYYVWFNKDSTGVNPLVIGRIGITVNISSADTAATVAQKTANAIVATASLDFSVINNFNGTITVTNTLAGFCTDAENFNVGSGFGVFIEIDGSGSALHTVSDGDLLEAAIKKLDQKIYEVMLSTPEQAYEEKINVTSLIASGTTLNLPLDSKNSNQVKSYTVGEGQLELFLNGQYLTVGQDWLEVGSAGAMSKQIVTLQDLNLSDVLLFRIDNHTIGSGGSESAYGEINTASNVGLGAAVFQSKVGEDLRFRTLVAGAGMSISQTSDSLVISSAPTGALLNVVTINGTNYDPLSSNDVILVNNLGLNVDITLPSASLNSGKRFDIKKIDGGNIVRIKGVSGDTLDGIDIFSSSLDIAIQYESVSVVSDGSNWYII
jgi:hypothetical protein